VPETDYIHATVETVLQIHKTQSFGNILGFLTDEEDIALTTTILLERIRELSPNINELIIIPIYPALPFDMEVSKSTPSDTRIVL
jgi:HrpA-like RNA helicase